MDWVVWLIFGLLILALIGFLVFTFLKDRRKNRKIIQKRNELRRATIKSSKELSIRIYTLILMNDELLKEVEPGYSKVKMRHVTATTRKFLKSIYDSRSFKAIYLDSKDADPSYARNIKTLIDTNSNLWHKYCQNEIQYFEKFYNGLKNDDVFNEIKDDSTNVIKDFFASEIGSVDKNESTK